MLPLLALVLITHSVPIPEHAVGPRIDLTIAIGASARVPRGVQEAALAEAADIWAPYGMALHLLPASNHERIADIVILADGAPALAAAPDILASVPIDGARNLLPVIEIRYDALVDLVLGTPGASWSAWSPAVRDRLLARALGRVMAHELGHIVLQSSSHSGGLMAAVQAGRDLVGVDRRHFMLSERDARRVRTAGFPCRYS
jgi:hypothetical protein